MAWFESYMLVALITGRLVRENLTLVIDHRQTSRLWLMTIRAFGVQLNEGHYILHTQEQLTGVNERTSLYRV